MGQYKSLNAIAIKFSEHVYSGLLNIIVFWSWPILAHESQILNSLQFCELIESRAEQ